MDTNVINTN